MEPHPIRLVVGDDLERSRLTVFFRAFLAIPHFIWLGLWGVGAFFVAIVAWFWVLITGRLDDSLAGFFSAFVRYGVHVYAYVFLAANPFPGFLGTAGSYPVDVEIDPPSRQSRWKTGFRLLLAIPALLLAGALVGVGGGGRWDPNLSTEANLAIAALSLSVSVVVAVLAWFAVMVRGRMPRGFRDLLGFALRYGAQAYAYLFFLTDRYPDADPASAWAAPPPPRPVELVSADDDLRRSRLTVFFRLLLALPHLVWLVLWSVAAAIVLVLGWFAALVTGRLPGPFHRFLAAFVRYQTHLLAFVALVANPFPGFTGTAGSYPVDVRIDLPVPQRRLTVLARGLLALPASLVSSALSGALWLAALLGWFVALALGRMPHGLRALGAYALGYSAQTNGYFSLLTAAYPYSGPPALVVPEEGPLWPVAPPSPFF